MFDSVRRFEQSTIIPRNTGAVNIRLPRIVQLCVILWTSITCVPCQIDWPRCENELHRNRFTGIRSFRGYSFDWTWESTDAPSWHGMSAVGTDRMKEYVVPRGIDRVPVSRWLKRYKEGCELYLLLGCRGDCGYIGSWKSLEKCKCNSLTWYQFWKH